MFVKAAPGLKVPKEEKPKEYVEDQVIVQLPNSAYNLRRVADGDLVESTQEEYDAQQADIAKRDAAAVKAVEKAAKAATAAE